MNFTQVKVKPVSLPEIVAPELVIIRGLPGSGKPSVWQILGRTVSRFIPFEAFTFLTNDKRGLHDTLTETYVIKD
jgi:uncharacterized RDD family membrane protein YckC